MYLLYCSSITFQSSGNRLFDAALVSFYSRVLKLSPSPMAGMFLSPQVVVCWPRFSAPFYCRFYEVVSHQLLTRLFVHTNLINQLLPEVLINGSQKALLTCSLILQVDSPNSAVSFSFLSCLSPESCSELTVFFTFACLFIHFEASLGFFPSHQWSKRFQNVSHSFFCYHVPCWHF